MEFDAFLDLEGKGLAAPRARAQPNTTAVVSFGLERLMVLSSLMMERFFSLSCLVLRCHISAMQHSLGQGYHTCEQATQ